MYPSIVCIFWLFTFLSVWHKSICWCKFQYVIILLDIFEMNNWYVHLPLCGRYRRSIQYVVFWPGTGADPSALDLGSGVKVSMHDRSASWRRGDFGIMSHIGKAKSTIMHWVPLEIWTAIVNFYVWIDSIALKYLRFWLIYHKCQHLLFCCCIVCFSKFYTPHVIMHLSQLTVIKNFLIFCISLIWIFQIMKFSRTSCKIESLLMMTFLTFHVHSFIIRRGRGRWIRRFRARSVVIGSFRCT